MFPIHIYQEKTNEFLSLLRMLVELESPTGSKEAVDRLGALIARELERLGARVTVEEQMRAGNHILAHWGEADRGGILLLCHFDTVHPIGMLAQNPCVEREGRLYGPGTQDMKAGIAAFLGAAGILRERGAWPDRPITALFTTDEEAGSHTSRPLIEALAREAALVLCLEPCLGDGSLKTWRKGIGDFELVARGRSAHAGAAHSQGLNAIEELAHQILRIQSWTDYEHGTTLNVGAIRGGTVTNVVPDEARAEIDLRVMTAEEGERITRRMFALRPALEGVSLEVRGGLNRPPMPRDERMAAAFRKAQEIARGLGLEVGEGGSGGGSDANFVAPLGVPVLDGLGPLGDGQHTGGEYVVIESIPERAALLGALLAAW
jgi:glutamate carboxypeptidase